MPRLTGSTNFARKLGQRIRELRHQAKLTQEAVALSANLNLGFISQLESGQRLPSLTVLIAVASALHVKPYDLLAFDANDARATLLDALREDDWSSAASALERLQAPKPLVTAINRRAKS
jgi:transcriptional regulator with XRE-family HTH domain